jgi:hypothetical protein
MVVIDSMYIDVELIIAVIYGAIYYLYQSRV